MSESPNIKSDIHSRR